MNKKFKLVCILTILSFSLTLLSCGSSKADAESAAKSYIDAYLNKDGIDYEKAGVSKDEVQNLICKRDYHVVNLYSREDGRDAEILKAYYDALKKAEYTVKSTSSNKDNLKAEVSIKGIDISKISDKVTSFSMKARREKKMSREELYKVMEDKAIEELGNAEVRDETDVELSFSKDSDGKLKLSDESIDSLENSLSFMGDDYSSFTGDVPQEFKDIENQK